MIILILVAIVLLFGLVVFRGAPYLPTMPAQVDIALDLLGLEKGQTLLELGSGDGIVLKKAAQRGLNVIGIELNPLLVIITYIRCWKYRKQVTIIWGDYWRKPWPASDGMYVFLLDKYMKKLDKKVIQYRKDVPYPLVSFTFKIPDKHTIRSKNGIHLYLYK
jgi:hypothetical protein